MDIYAADVPDRQDQHPASDQTSTTSSVAAAESWINLSLMIEDMQCVTSSFSSICHPSLFRIDIQDRVRRLTRVPSSADQITVERSRLQLSTLFAQLPQLQANAGVTSLAAAPAPQALDASPAPPAFDDTQFEDEMEDISSENPDPVAQSPVPVPEQQMLHLPSNRNVTGNLGPVELRLRKQQAKKHLTKLRELIADKSFQYSHVIRDAPRKAVSTRARTVVKNLNMEIAHCARLYNHCRSRLMLLGADAYTLDIFRHLSYQDIKASTAILDPNTPGSTQICLSWIWQSKQTISASILAGAGSDIVDPASITECEYYPLSLRCVAASHDLSEFYFLHILP
jgi:hypothetical protein